MIQQNKELEELNDQKNELLGIAAHDIRNPLALIQGYADLLLIGAGGALSPPQTQLVERVRASSEFMLKLVNEMLDFSKIESGTLTLDVAPTDIGEFLSNNVGMNRFHAEKKSIGIEWKPATALPMMMVDASKLEQVFNNLITNAIKFSKSETTIQVVARTEGTRLIVDVIDEGLGIPKPFQTTSVRSTGGEKSTGLGLAICQKIIGGHDGRIVVESEVGKGSTFRVELPIVEPPTR